MEKQGAVWVSTVLYILISLAIIGIVIAAVTPRINSAKDKAAIEQSIAMLESIDSTLERASQVQGTTLKSEFKMSRGLLIINPATNRIVWQLNDSAYKYSEPDIMINISNIQAKTMQASQGKGWVVELSLNYAGKINITFAGSTNLKILQPAEVPYKLWMENKGNNVIDISVT